MGSRRRQLARYRTVALVLVRHGFGQLGATLGLSPWAADGAPMRWAGCGRAGGLDGAHPLGAGRSRPHLHQACQLASTRTDLLPPRLVAALEQLQDHVAPISMGDVESVLRHAWGTDPASVLWLDPTALASASIAQGHGGQLPDGRWVAVKVRRPGILATAQADGDIVMRLAAVAEARFPWARQYDVSGLVGELVPAFLAELDLTTEGHHTEEAARLARADPGVRIPDVVWELTRPEVLVMTRRDGAKVTERSDLEARGLDPMTWRPGWSTRSIDKFSSTGSFTRTRTRAMCTWTKTAASSCCIGGWWGGSRGSCESTPSTCCWGWPGATVRSSYGQSGSWVRWRARWTAPG
ncbi:MAG: AarF/ABC1/UbiB kinase family protein [Thermaerobacter sp.]|nr:AarF/ABC1/UbiB kinase family protein [Thermaerobacter sp.]